MAEECARTGIGKPGGLAADRETDARARGYAEGALAANTCKDGLLGNMHRAKHTSTGRPSEQHQCPHRPHDRWIEGLAMSRREDETWKIIGAFVVACALLTASIIVL